MKQISLLIFIILLSACNAATGQPPEPGAQTMATATAYSTMTTHATPTLPVPSITTITTLPLPTSSLAVNIPTPTSPVSQQGLYQVVTLPNPQNDLLTDVYIHNTGTGEEQFFTSLEHVYRDHYHHAEYHNGSLYIIKRIGYDGYPDEDWSDELWRYDAQGASKQLFVGKGFDFRVAPDESYAVVTYADMVSGEGAVAFVQIQAGQVTREFSAATLGQSEGNDARPLGWSASSRQCWGLRSVGPIIFSLFAIDTSSWSVATYDVSSLQINNSAEFTLNRDTGRIVFSDYPPFFDVESRDNFVASKEVVTLFVYELNTQEMQTITTSTAQEFAPKWLSDNVIEYNNPNGEGRITSSIP